MFTLRMTVRPCDRISGGTLERSVFARFRDFRLLVVLTERLTSTASTWLVVSLVCCKLMVSKQGMDEQRMVGQTSHRLVWLRLRCFKFSSCGIIVIRFVADCVPRSDSDRSKEWSLLNLVHRRNCSELVEVTLFLEITVEDHTNGSLPTW